jgi:hypothetical protein
VGLEEATRLTPLGDGRYGIDLDVDFAIMGTKPNGGYLLTSLGRAAVLAADAQPYVVAASVQYGASPDLGPAVIETTVHRVGRTASQVTASIGAVRAQCTIGALHESSAPHWGAVAPPEMPPREDCLLAGRPEGTSDAGNRMAFDPGAALDWGGEGPSGGGGGELRAWFWFADERAFTPLDLLYVVDCMPPATFTVLNTGWVPTLDLSVYVRAVPAPGPLRIRFRVQVIQDGFADEICEVWDSQDRLVAQSTQLAALRLPEG